MPRGGGKHPGRERSHGPEQCSAEAWTPAYGFAMGVDSVHMPL